MVGKAGCDAEWVPMTPHTSQIVRDTQEQLSQAQAHTYIAVWPPSALQLVTGIKKAGPEGGMHRFLAFRRPLRGHTHRFLAVRTTVTGLLLNRYTG